MGSMLGSYEIARSGMYVSERSLIVTGHNLANATTPGYVRQQAIIATSRYTTEGGKFQVGLGAQIEQTRQIRHTFLDAIYRRENTALGYWETRDKSFQDMQTILGDPPMTGVDGDLNIGGLQNVMNQFWDSWHELSKDPSSLTIRALVRQRSSTLVEQFNHVGKQLDDMQMNLNEEIKVRVNELNDITSQIAKLNVTIMQNEVNGDHANDFRDQRNLLIDKLSKLANVEVQEMQGGWTYITLGGNILVNRGVSTDIYLDKSTTYAPFYVPKLEGTNTAITFKSGIIKGLLDSRGDEFECPGSSGASAGLPSDVNKMSVSEMKKLLNNLVLNLATQVNNLHKTGVTMVGTPPISGQDFFSTIKGGNLGLSNIKLNDNIMTNLNYIVASKTAAVGDNEVAREMGNLKHKAMLGSTTQNLSPDEYYNSIILQMGTRGQEAATNTNSQNILVQSSDNSRKKISDVSMDEEMANMMKFQFAYGASSRTINVIDEMVETVISRMGLVGR